MTVGNVFRVGGDQIAAAVLGCTQEVNQVLRIGTRHSLPIACLRGLYDLDRAAHHALKELLELAELRFILDEVLQVSAAFFDRASRPSTRSKSVNSEAMRTT